MISAIFVKITFLLILFSLDECSYDSSQPLFDCDWQIQDFIIRKSSNLYLYFDQNIWIIITYSN